MAETCAPLYGVVCLRWKGKEACEVNKTGREDRVGLVNVGCEVDKV